MSDIYFVFVEDMDADAYRTLDDAIDAMKHAFFEGAEDVLVNRQDSEHE
jgi:hypothetical protein